MHKFIVPGLIALVVLFIIVISVYFGYKNWDSDSFTSDAEIYKNAKIIHENVKNVKKLDYDKYKKLFSNHPKLIDVTIYDSIKKLNKWNVGSIYNAIKH